MIKYLREDNMGKEKGCVISAMEPNVHCSGEGLISKTAFHCLLTNFVHLL